MNSTGTLKHYKTKNDYLQKRVSSKVDSVKDVISKDAKPLKSVEDSVKISDDAKKKLSDVKESAKKNLKEQIKKDGSTLKKAGSHLLGDALSVAAKALPSPLQAPVLKITGAEKSAVTKEDIKNTMPINKPGIFFIEGLHLGSISSDDGGLKDLSSAINGAEHFSWQDEDKVFELIKRRPLEQPIVLVGHSLGGDAVVNLTNRLNSIEGGFRKVDLAVTLDSVGFNNDIIPQNVKKNLNFISDDDYFFNDGPNIARDSKLTEVINDLRPAKHTDIDEDNDVHFDIVTNIHEVIGEFKHKKRVEKLTDMYNYFKKS